MSKSSGRPVVFDGSFLMAVAERPTTWREDLTDELGAFRPVILDCVAEELERIAGAGLRRSRYASLAGRIAGTFTHARSGGGKADDEIISYSKTEGAAVATIDRDLMERLRHHGIEVITLRGGRVSV